MSSKGKGKEPPHCFVVMTRNRNASRLNSSRGGVTTTLGFGKDSYGRGLVPVKEEKASGTGRSDVRKGGKEMGGREFLWQ